MDYIPNFNYYGNDEFTYIDPQTKETLGLSIYVKPINDKPMLGIVSPITMSEDTVKTIPEHYYKSKSKVTYK